MTCFFIGFAAGQILGALAAILGMRSGIRAWRKRQVTTEVKE